MAGPDRYPGPLGDVEAKQAKLFKQSGRLPASVKGEITPTIICGDINSPGNPVTSNRRFAYGESMAPNPGFFSKLVLQPTADVVIERMWLGSAVVGTCRIGLIGATAAKTYVPTNFVTPWIESLQTSLDVAPLATLPVITDAASSGQQIWVGFVPISTIQLDMPLHLPQGAQLIAHGLLPNTAFVFAFQGYLY